MTEIIKRPDEGGEYPATYYPGQMGPVVYDSPEWTALQPPYDPDSEIQKVWSMVMTPFRGIAIAFLWLTLAWWRFGLAAALVIAVYLIMSGHGQGGGER